METAAEKREEERAIALPDIKKVYIKTITLLIHIVNNSNGFSKKIDFDKPFNATSCRRNFLQDVGYLGRLTENKRVAKG